MEERKWENLPYDCLVEIFSRVGVVVLVEEVQFVCKSWYEATLSPLCWQSLIFPKGFGPHWYGKYGRANNFRYNYKAIIKLAIHRSRGSANAVVFDSKFQITNDILNLISEGCPSLKKLELPVNHSDIFSCLICKWKNLEALKISQTYYLEGLLKEIAVHCKKIASLCVAGSAIGESGAYAIANHLPNIKFLGLKGALMERPDLVILLKGCRKLGYFDSGSWRDNYLDDEIRNLAAHIPTFTYKVLNYYKSVLSYFPGEDYHAGYHEGSDND